MGFRSETDTRLRGRSLGLVRATWLVLMTLTLGLIAAGAPAFFRRVQTVCVAGHCVSFQLSQEDAQVIGELGLSLRLYAWYMTAWSLFSMLAFLIIAAAVFWRQSNSRMAIFMSFALVVSAPTLFSPLTESLVRAQPIWHWPVILVQALGVWGSIVSFYLFPDGRFVPRWTRPLAGLVAAYALALFLFSSLPAFLTPDTWLERLLFLMLLGLTFAGVAAQVYRYRRVSGPIERQQTKWVIFGMAAFASEHLIGFLLLPLLVPSLRQPGFPRLLYYLVGGTLNILFILLLALSFAIAILRYRLWDIDVIIRRTLIYGAVTSALALVYFGGVVLLQAIFRATTGQGSQIAIVASTLAIAALFAPLRRYVQDRIDRRFYRKKYDAAKVLAAFGATVRDETDLDRLTQRLVEVVQETVQPAHVSLWLKPSSPNPHPRPYRPGEAEGDRGVRGEAA